MRQRSLTVNLGYDITGARVVGLSSFLITQARVIEIRVGEVVMGWLGKGTHCPPRNRISDTMV